MTAKQKRLSRLIVILGPTASGKTDLGVFLAKKFKGEVINADSRQIYKEMSIGTAKPEFEIQNSKFEIDNIPHHLFDIAKPDKTITLAVWKRKALQVIRDIIKRGKMPILVGGTGLYMQAIVENLQIPRVPPNKKLRESFEKKSAKELLKLLAKLDPDAAANLDPRNPRRIIRALEVSIWTGKPFSKQQKRGKPLFDVLEIGITFSPRQKLYDRIDKRVEIQIKEGLVEETKRLIKKYPRATPSLSGIGYYEIADYLDGKLSLEEAKQKIKYRTHNYARRQLIWFRRNKKIHWIKTKKETENLVKDFLAS